MEHPAADRSLQGKLRWWEEEEEEGGGGGHTEGHSLASDELQQSFPPHVG